MLGSEMDSQHKYHNHPKYQDFIDLNGMNSHEDEMIYGNEPH